MSALHLPQGCRAGGLSALPLTAPSPRGVPAWATGRPGVGARCRGRQSCRLAPVPSEHGTARGQTHGLLQHAGDPGHQLRRATRCWRAGGVRAVCVPGLASTRCPPGAGVKRSGAGGPACCFAVGVLRWRVREACPARGEGGGPAGSAPWGLARLGEYPRTCSTR